MRIESKLFSREDNAAQEFEPISELTTPDFHFDYEYFILPPAVYGFTSSTASDS